MALIVPSKRWGWQKPAPGAVIDWGHPLAPGLLSACIFAEGGGQTVYDDALGNPLSMQGNGWQMAQRPFGPSAQLSAGAIVNGGGTSTGLSLGTPNQLAQLTSAISIVVGFNMNVVDATRGGSNNPIFVAQSANAGGNFQLDMNGNPAFFRFFCHGAGLVSTTHSYGGGVPTVAAATFDSTSKAAALYRDGVLLLTGTGTTAMTAFPTIPYTIGYRVFTTGGNFTGAWGGSLGFCYIWGGRVLTPADMQALWVDPFAMYQPQAPVGRFWAITATFPDTGTGDIELTASATIIAVPTAAAALTLTAANVTAALETATGAIALSASASESADPTATADLELIGGATESADPTGAAAITLSASGSDTADPTAAAATTLIGAAAESPVSTAAGFVTVTASATSSSVPTATADLELVGTGTNEPIASATGDIELVGVASPQAIDTASGSLTLVAGVAVSAQSVAVGDVEVTASGSSSASTAPAASVSLSASSTVIAPADAPATITLVGTALPFAPMTATAQIALVGFAHVEPPAPGTQRVALWTFGQTRERVWHFGGATTLWVFGQAIPRGSLPAVDRALLVP